MFVLLIFTFCNKKKKTNDRVTKTYIFDIPEI